MAARLRSDGFYSLGLASRLTRIPTPDVWTTGISMALFSAICRLRTAMVGLCRGIPITG